MKPPKNLDLPNIDPPSGAELVNDAFKTVSPELTGQQNFDGEQMHQITKALIAITNQSWRISSTVVDNETKDAKEEVTSREIKKIYKALEVIEETLAGLGINSIDRVGEVFDAGLPEQVVSEESREGISKDQIVRTIRPTIMWNQTMVQRGEIDIAVPTATI